MTVQPYMYFIFQNIWMSKTAGPVLDITKLLIPNFKLSLIITAKGFSAMFFNYIFLPVQTCLIHCESFTGR